MPNLTASGNSLVVMNKMRKATMKAMINDFLHVILFNSYRAVALALLIKVSFESPFSGLAEA